MNKLVWYRAPLLRATIDALLLARFPSGNLPSSLGSKKDDVLVHWCHGATGALIPGQVCCPRTVSGCL